MSDDDDARDPKTTSASTVPMKTQIALALVVCVLIYLGYRTWRERRTHKISFRASSTLPCRETVDYEPGPVSVDEAQLGVATPYQKNFESREGTTLRLRVSGDRTCESVTCEIFLGELLIARSTVSTKEGGADATCAALAAKPEAALPK